ncbi:MAG: hypothetical protein H0W02_00535 [Ktedonobacteraceae bacterium]|nr:hypothetical protein [Ktedonobacteraceae bacterium]MDQ2905585.1 hypothetical protein [Chloroflexota bacterium]
MATTTNEVRAKKIEIVDQPEEVEEKKGLNIKLLIPVILVAAAITLIIVRRLVGSNED